MAPTRPDSPNQATIGNVQRADGLATRSAGRRIRRTQRDPQSRHSESAQELARYSGPDETTPSKTSMNKLIEERLKSERAMELERGRWEAAQREELRDTLSCATSEEKAISHKDAEHEPHFSKVLDESARHLVTLDEKDDQKIFQDDALLRRMRRLDLRAGKTEMKILMVRLDAV